MISSEVAATEVEFFSFKWLDTSAISLVDFAQSFTNYSVENESRRQKKLQAGDPVLFQIFTQSRVRNKNTFSIASLDLVLGLVGGFAAICWGTLGLILNPYESFKFENSLIGSVFPTSAGGGEHGDLDIVPTDEQEAKAQMVASVAGRGKYFYNFGEYLSSKLLRSFCRCFGCCKGRDWFRRRMKRLERHEHASSKLCREMDIVNLIYVHRLSQFMTKLVLKKHQRALVTFFKKYTVDDLSYLEEDSPIKQQMVNEAMLLQSTGIQTEEDDASAPFFDSDSLTETKRALVLCIAREFKPVEDDADLGILYETTGYQL